MANRRMFSKIITDSDEFLEMPMSARLLYYDLGMRADDDGFVQPKRVMRITGASGDDLKVLLAKQYVINFDDKVLVIRDWKINNNIRSDRYTETTFTEYKNKLYLAPNRSYTLDKTVGIPDVIPEVYPVKDSIDKERKEKTREEEDSLKGEENQKDRRKMLLEQARLLKDNFSF